ncbi:unnamed protein product [Vicia faba]|uniref:Uncharacterized protein n=1 Tax=Vicia faba TaxID=3906 RepID=A0AAV1AXY7_VICFA|nr:unnamed protein product [Vicia faba]
MAYQIKEIRERLDKIAADGTKFGLANIDVGPQLVIQRRELTHSHVDTSSVIVICGAYVLKKRKREQNGEEKNKNTRFWCVAFAMAQMASAITLATSPEPTKAHGVSHEHNSIHHLTPIYCGCTRVSRKRNSKGSEGIGVSHKKIIDEKQSAANS